MAYRDAVSGATGDVHVPAANTAAVVTYAALDAAKAHVIDQIFWSYSAAPTGGTLKVEDVAGTVVFGPHHITAAGPDSLTFDPPLRSAIGGTAMIVTLAAGGAGITGVLTCRHRAVQA